MRILKSRDGEVTVLALQGKLGRRSLPQLRNCMEQLLHGGARQVIFNLRAVPTSDSTAAAYIAEVHKRVHEQNGRLVITEANRVVRTAFDDAGGKFLLRLVPDNEAAMAYFERQRQSRAERAEPETDIAEEPGLRLRLDLIDDRPFLGLAGDFDSGSLEAVRGGIDTMVRQGVRELVLNCRRVRFINSSAMGLLIQTSTRLRQLGGELVLSDISPYLASAFETLGIDESLRIVANNGAALRYFRERGNAASRSPLDLKSEHVKRLGSARLEFQLIESPERSAEGRLLYIEGDGIVFAYPAQGRDQVIDGSELGLRRRLRVRIAHPARTWLGDLEMEGQIAQARAIEGDPAGAIMYHLRYTRIDPEDRAALDTLRGVESDE